MKHQKRNKLMLLVCAAAFSMTACSSSNSFSDPIDMETPEVNPNPTPAAGMAKTFTTTADGNYSLMEGESKLFNGVSMAPVTIELDLNKKFQAIDGFGYAITYSSCYNLMHMTEADRLALLKRLYSTTEGYGVSYARISLGCNDFSSTEYTYCDQKGSDADPLSTFALHNDENQYVIPVLKEILAINPNVKIIAAPWTCPKWMKVADINTKTPKDSWTDGHLNPDYRELYAKYFVKFIQTMKEKGINIYAVSPQNEPLNKANCASLYMPWQEEAPFVKALAGEFKKNNVSTKIYVFDHNYNYDNVADQNDYPIKVYNALGNNYEGSELVVGAAYHDYGGNNSELTDINNQRPDKELIFSETSIGTWNNGRDLSKRLMADMKNVALATVNQYCKAVLVWNLMLDKKMGPNLDGGCQTCYGAIDIDQNGYKKLTYNSHYYIINHMSSVVAPGAIRIGTTSRTVSDKKITHAEFLNPDGSLAAVILNEGDNEQSINLSDGTHNFTIKVPANGVISCKWNK